MSKKELKKKKAASMGKPIWMYNCLSINFVFRQKVRKKTVAQIKTFEIS